MHKHTQSSLKPPLHCGKKKKANRPQPQPPHRRGTFHRRLQPLYTEKHKVSCFGFLPKTEPMQHHAASTLRSATTDSKTPYNYACTSTPKAAWSHRYIAARKKRQTDRSRNRRTDEVPFIAGCSHFTRKNVRFRASASSRKQSPCNIMQPLHCDLQPQIPKHPITTHTQAHPKQLEATVTMRQEKRQTDRSCNRRTDEVPFITGCNHFTRKNARFRAPAFSRKQSPCNIMQPLCDLKAQIPKHPITTRHKHTQSSLKPPLQCGKRKRQTDRSRNRRTDEVPFIAGCSHFTRKNTRFRAPASSPKQSPCNIMQPFQCDLQAQFPKHPITTQTQAHPTQLEATVTMRQKKGKPTAAATAAQTRYLSSPAAATLHGKTQGFVLRLPPENRAHATSCSHYNAICNHRFQNTL